MPPTPQLLFDGPKSAPWTIALAHGAGAGMNTPFMSAIAEALAKRGHRVARFEFLYMAERSAGGKGRPPDREPVLRESWLKVVETLGRERLIIGGKSMGGRMASLIADQAGVAGLVCLGYPFHPVGKPTQLRVEHLRTLKTLALIVQGERDPFGTQAEVGTYNLPSAIQIRWMIDGEHSFKPRKKSGVTEEQNLQAAVEQINSFVQRLSS